MNKKVGVLRVARSLCLGAVMLAALLMMGSLGAYAQTEIQVWMTGISADYQQWLDQEFKPAFEADNPDIKLQFSNRGWDGHGEQVAVSIATGTGPDVVVRGRGSAFRWGLTGFLRPLDDYLAKWEGTKEIHPLAWEGREGGKTYIVPRLVDVRGIAYNKDVFEESGLDANTPLQSWVEILAAARATTRLNSDKMVRRGVASFTGSPPFGPTQHFMAFVRQRGGRTVSEDYREPTFNNEYGLDALQFMTEIERISAPPGIDTSGSFPFNAGETAMQRTGSGVVRSLRVADPDRLKHLGFFLPRYTTDSQPHAQGFGNGYSIPNTSKNPDKAWRVIETLLNHENSKHFTLLNGFFPIRSDLREWVMETIPEFMPWYESLDHLEFFDLMVDSDSMYPSMSERIYAAVQGEMDPKNALETIEHEWRGYIDAFFTRFDEELNGVSAD